MSSFVYPAQNAAILTGITGSRIKWSPETLVTFNPGLSMSYIANDVSSEIAENGVEVYTKQRVGTVQAKPYIPGTTALAFEALPFSVDTMTKNRSAFVGLEGDPLRDHTAHLNQLAFRDKAIQEAMMQHVDEAVIGEIVSNSSSPGGVQALNTPGTAIEMNSDRLARMITAMMAQLDQNEASSRMKGPMYILGNTNLRTSFQNIGASRAASSEEVKNLNTPQRSVHEFDYSGIPVVLSNNVVNLPSAINTGLPVDVVPVIMGYKEATDFGVFLELDGESKNMEGGQNFLTRQGKLLGYGLKVWEPTALVIAYFQAPTNN